MNLSKIEVNLGKTDDVSGIDDKWLSPVGRLGKALDKWNKITVVLYLSNVVKEGYILPVRAIPAKGK